MYLQQLKGPVVKERVKPDASCFWKISASSNVEGMGSAPGRDKQVGAGTCLCSVTGPLTVFDVKAFQDCQEKQFLCLSNSWVQLLLVLFGFYKNIFYCKILVLVDTCLNKIYEMVYSKGP